MWHETGSESGLLTPRAPVQPGNSFESAETKRRLKRVDNAYALVRPIGHHAERDLGRGFCIFNNGAVAGRHAMREHGLQRIAFVDWNVHHGNGTERIFYDDPSVLTISLHHDNWMPANSGHVASTGADVVHRGADGGWRFLIDCLWAGTAS